MPKKTISKLSKINEALIENVKFPVLTKTAKRWKKRPLVQHYLMYFAIFTLIVIAFFLVLTLLKACVVNQ